MHLPKQSLHACRDISECLFSEDVRERGRSDSSFLSRQEQTFRALASLSESRRIKAADDLSFTHETSREGWRTAVSSPRACAASYLRGRHDVQIDQNRSHPSSCVEKLQTTGDGAGGYHTPHLKILHTEINSAALTRTCLQTRIQMHIRPEDPARCLSPSLQKPLHVSVTVCATTQGNARRLPNVRCKYTSWCVRKREGDAYLRCADFVQSNEDQSLKGKEMHADRHKDSHRRSFLTALPRTRGDRNLNAHVRIFAYACVQTPRV